jgi:long-chain acyl-CoA synthetase
MKETVIGRSGQVHKEKGDTWPKILKFNFEEYGHNRRAMRHKHFGIWQVYSWENYYHQVKSLALGLLSLGLESGDKVVIVGDNAPEWYYAELAAQAAHGVSVGVCPDLLPREIKTIAENSEARFAIVEDQEQVDKFLQIKAELPLLKKVIYWNYKGLAHYDDPVLMGNKQVLRKGDQYEAEHPGLFELLVETGQADNICALVYTSGTSETVPKGAVHTYKTMRAGADHYLQLDPWYENDNVVPFLPPVWMPEQWAGIGCHLLSACTLNFAEAPETQQRDTKETRPSIIFYNARVWESLAAMVQARILGNDLIQKLAYRLLMPIGYKTADLRFHKKKPDFFRKTLHGLADLVLFRPLKNSLGLSKARICYSTGAVLSPEAFQFFHALNLPLKSLYHTTEGGSLTDARDEDICTEMLGPVPKGTEVKITDNGELIYRQPGIFVGYYKDAAKTAEVLKDGWFFSGDSAFIREDGHIVFLDRGRDLIKLKSGEKLAPQWIESRLKFSPYIKEAWVLAGPDQAFVSAILILNYDTVRRWAGQKRVAYTTFADLSQKSEVYELVKRDIDRINSTLSPGCRIKKYVNLYKELDPDEGEVTRDKKLRRPFLEERFRQLIDSIYGDKSEVSIEARVRYQDGRTGTIKTTLSIKSAQGAIV